MIILDKTMLVVSVIGTIFVGVYIWNQDKLED